MAGMEDHLLLERAEDLRSLNLVRHKPQFMGFLDERQQFLLHGHFQKNGFTDYLFYGGYEGASRCFLAVDVYNPPEAAQWPIDIAAFSFRTQDVLTHRDFLGALMAQGIKRESIGDILVTAGKANVFLDQNVIGFVLAQVEKIGRIGVRAAVAEACTVVPVQDFRILEGTVSALRLDCLVSMCTGLSREKAKQLLLAKQVSYQYQTCQDAACLVREGAILSIRGYGKFLIDKVGGSTRKGRLFLTVKQYI